MQHLHFEELTLLSKSEKKARKIVLAPKRNVILGENDVGKSTFIKSLYHALGADTPQLNNNRWMQARPIYCIRFSVGGARYSIVRDEKYFGLFDEAGVLLGQYTGVGRSGGVGATVNNLLGFDIELETPTGEMRPVSPAYYFLPFYIDQDEGWNMAWSSFKGVQGIKNYRKNMVEYHLGIRPQAYYDARKRVFELNKTMSELRQEKSGLIRVRDSYRSKKRTELLDLDATGFRADAEALVAQYNEIYERQQDVLALIKDARNRKLNLVGQIDVLERSIKELDADYIYVESPTVPDVIDCPTCGTEFENSIAERFGILDDIDYCRSLADQRRKQIKEVDEELAELDERYSAISNELSSVDALLKRKRDEISLADVVRSEGYKDVLNSIAADINAVDSQQAELERELAASKSDLSVDRDLKKAITEFYQAQMKSALDALNVHVLSEDDYKTVDRRIKNNAIGSDLPRALLAQCFSYLSTMKKFNEFVVCPLVIDSPLQQEQDDTNTKAIFDFIFSGLLDEQQLVLGTLPSQEWVYRALEDEELNVISLDTKYGLLSKDEYESALEEVGPMHRLAISSQIDF